MFQNRKRRENEPGFLFTYFDFLFFTFALTMRIGRAREMQVRNSLTVCNVFKCFWNLYAWLDQNTTHINVEMESIPFEGANIFGEKLYTNSNRQDLNDIRFGANNNRPDFFIQFGFGWWISAHYHLYVWMLAVCRCPIKWWLCIFYYVFIIVIQICRNIAKKCSLFISCSCHLNGIHVIRWFCWTF